MESLSHENPEQYLETLKKTAAEIRALLSKLTPQSQLNACTKDLENAPSGKSLENNNLNVPPYCYYKPSNPEDRKLWFNIALSGNTSPCTSTSSCVCQNGIKPGNISQATSTLFPSCSLPCSINMMRRVCTTLFMDQTGDIWPAI